MKNFILLILVLISNILIINAKDVKGIVYGVDSDDNKQILPQARVMLEGTTNGVITDKEGKFSITVPNNSKRLIISFIGYKKDTVELKSSNDFLEIALQTELEFDEIEVNASKPASIVSKTDIIKREDITLKGLQKAACCNLAESFVTNPSVDVHFSDALTGARQIQLLGLRGIYTQLMTEKIPNLRGIASSFGLGYIPGPWMESIQISKGSSSVSTGYESITGQINIEYKKPEESDPMFLNFYSDLMGRLEGSANTVVRLNDKVSTMLMLHANTMQTKFDNNSDSFLDDPLVTQYNVFNRWRYEGEVWESMTGVKALYEDRQAGQKEFFTKNYDSLYGVKIKTERYEFFTKNGFIFHGEKFRSIGTIVSLTKHKQNSVFGKNKYDGDQSTFYTNLMYQSELFGKENSIITGFSYMYDNYDEKFNDSTMSRKESVPGVFAEYTYKGIQNLTVMAGVRADFHNLYNTFFTPRLHIKYDFSDNSSVRASVGKGYRVATIIPENSGFLASSRKFIIDEKLEPEEAWNYGLSYSTDFKFIGLDWTLHADYYRTDFINQVIVDAEQDVHSVHFYNLKGKSYSNSFQLDLNFEPIKRLDVKLAYRFNDVKMTINNELVTKPLQSTHKGFVNFGYATDLDEWLFDFTIDINGGGRIPSTSQNPVEYRLKSDYPAFVLLHTQVTKKFDDWEIYVGAENIADYTQPDPIIAATQPDSKYFDSSLIWGPLMGRKLYAGIRLNLFN